MKKILLFIFIAANLTQSVFAQVVTKTFNTPAIQAFAKGKTYAILTNDDGFNQWWQSTLQKVWTSSDLNFIPATSLDSIVISDKNIFLFAQAKDDRTAAVHLLNSDDITKKKEFYVVLTQGGYKQSKLLFTPATTGPKVIGSFRFAPDRADLTAGMFECEMLLALLNQSVQVIVDSKIKSEVKDSVKYVITDPNADQIKDKTLLINRAYNDGSIALEGKPIISDKVLNDYPYPYQIVGKDSVNDLVNDGSNYAYLFFYFPSQYLKTTDDVGDILVYDPSQKKFLYFDDNMDGPWFDKSKLKDMIYAIKSR